MAAPCAAAPPEPFRGRLAFQVYAEDQGLGNTAIECLLQDHTGFLWLGTQDGLFRYDGHSFVRFGRSEGLPSSRINMLHETADGRLFVATRSGLAVREALGFRAIGPAEGLPEAVTADAGVASDRQGRVYVATPDGLFVGTGGRFQRASPAGRAATAVSIEASGSLLYALGAHLFRRSGDGAIEEIGVSRGLDPVQRLDAIVVDHDRRLWVRSVSKLWRLDPAAANFQHVDSGLPASVAIGRLALDGRGALLVPTGQGLYQFESPGWHRLGLRDGLPSETVFSALVDREGTLWLGLGGVGLAQRLGDGSIAAWTRADGLAHDVVWAVRRASAGGPLWVGTEQGLSRLEPDGSVRSFTERDGLAGNTVYALANDAVGRVWVASWPGGVTRVDPDGRLVRVAAEGLAPADFGVASIHVDARGAVWAGTQRGPYRLTPGDTRFRAAGIPGADDERDSVYGFAETDDGALWAASRYGLQRLAPDPPRRYRRADGLAADFLSSLIALPGSRLLVGYREALGAAAIEVEADHLVMQPFTERNPLSFAKVLFVGRDASGAVWLGGGAGIDVLDDHRRLVRHYARADGMASEDMSQNAFFAETGDGGTWVGTSRGLLHVRAGHAPVAAAAPPILLTGAWGGSRALRFDAPERLEQEERSLRVAWASLTFRNTRHGYRYRLLGLDDEETATTLSEARFAALPSGRYRFEVRAVGSDGTLSAAPAVFEFEVARAPWETWWARLGFACAAQVSHGDLVGASRIRLRRSGAGGGRGAPAHAGAGAGARAARAGRRRADPRAGCGDRGAGGSVGHGSADAAAQPALLRRRDRRGCGEGRPRAPLPGRVAAQPRPDLLRGGRGSLQAGERHLGPRGRR